MHFCYAKSLEGLGYGNVVHKFEKRYKVLSKARAQSTDRALAQLQTIEL